MGIRHFSSRRLSSPILLRPAKIFTLLCRAALILSRCNPILARDAYFAYSGCLPPRALTFVGHVPDRVTAGEASDAGQKSIEHLTGRASRLFQRRAFADSKTVCRRSHEGNEDAIPRARTFLAARTIGKLFRQASRRTDCKIHPEPNLASSYVDSAPERRFSDAWDGSLARSRRKYIPLQVLANWQKGVKDRDKGATPLLFSLRASLMQASLHIVGKMKAAGVPIMAGTDTTAPFVFPGSSLHEELALLVQAGLTRMQALQAATKLPAEFLGKLQTQGTIEQGKIR